MSEEGGGEGERRCMMGEGDSGINETLISAAKNISRILFHSKSLERNELFLPGRMVSQQCDIVQVCVVMM